MLLILELTKTLIGVTFLKEDQVDSLSLITVILFPIDLVKREHSNMQHIYTETVNLEMEELPPFIEQGVIEFFPHVGHCLCLRSWFQNDNPMTAETDVYIPGLELKVRFFFAFGFIENPSLKVA